MSYNSDYSQPTYDSIDDKKKYQEIREADYILEEAVPREPTRNEELAYMEWL
jgi:hypothetical protein